MATLYKVRRLKIGHTEQMDALARAAGKLYSQVVVWFWRTVRHKDLWLKAKHLMRWVTSALLYAHSSDAAKGRMYRCRNKECGFVFHRDGVGALNIRKKYTGSSLVVGATASPIGVRYQPHLRCNTALA
jgi:transposase